MAIQFSSIIAAQAQKVSTFSVQNIDLQRLGERASPLQLFHDFRLRGRPFGPHPHGGFSVISYVFEDSPSGLRSRDSLGNDFVIGPGGMVWTQAGSGLMHQEVAADNDRELHGLQAFVNLSSKNKLAAPQVLRLERRDVPEWRSGTGDRVRVLVGTFEGVSSPLVPTEPFTFLEVGLRGGIAFNLRAGHNALLYVFEGRVRVLADDHEQKVTREHALALFGTGGEATLEPLEPAHLLVLSGAEICEPVVAGGPFIMNNQAQIDAAFARYRAGAMGHLAAQEEQR